MVYKALVRPWLFQADPEAAHERALNLAGSLGRCRVARDRAEQGQLDHAEGVQAVALAAELPEDHVASHRWSPPVRRSARLVAV